MSERVHKSLLNTKVNLVFYFLSLFFDLFFTIYFLLSTNLYAITFSLRENPIPILEFVITPIISLIVICGCLGISSTLRMSSSAAYYLFGVNNKRKNI